MVSLYNSIIKGINTLVQQWSDLLIVKSPFFKQTVTLKSWPGTVFDTTSGESLTKVVDVG